MYYLLALRLFSTAIALLNPLFIDIAIAKPNQSKPILNKHYIYASIFNELFVFSIFRKLQTPALCHNHNMTVYCDRV